MTKFPIFVIFIVTNIHPASINHKYNKNSNYLRPNSQKNCIVYEYKSHFTISKKRRRKSRNLRILKNREKI